MTRETGHAVVAVIPARYDSSRFPGKPLARIAGKPMIQWVYEAARQAAVDHVVVATDDRRIRDCVRDFGGEAVMTDRSHATGTDRIAQAVSGMAAELIVNVQGDEPLMPPAVIDGLIDGMRRRPGADMGTVAVPLCPNAREFTDPNVVKVVLDDNQCALYFSRAPIPCNRDDDGGVHPLHHWGLYAYRRRFLEQFVSWPQGRLERCERLEQLRALEHGADIYVLTATASTVGVDVPEDIPRVEALIHRRHTGTP